MTTDHDDTDFEPPHTSSPTDHVLAELQLYGYRPFQDEPDPRPLPEGRRRRRRRRRHLRRPGRHPGRHPPRTRPRGPALVDRQPLPPRRRPHRARTRRQRAGAAAQPEGTGRLRNPLGRTGAPHRRRADADRTPQQHGILPRPGRRPVRAPHRLSLAAALRIDGQPSHADLGHDRQPRFPRRQDAAPRTRCCCRPARRSPSPAASTSTIIALIWDRLDKVHAKHPDMVLLHGGSPKGAERIAANWADQPQGAADRLQARLDEARQGRARSSATTQMLDVLPIGVMVVPRHRHPGQPRRQGQEARHPGLEVRQRRRVSAAHRAQKIRLRPEPSLYGHGQCTCSHGWQLSLAGPADAIVATSRRSRTHLVYSPQQMRSHERRHVGSRFSVCSLARFRCRPPAVFGYSLACAVVVVEGATVRPLSRECTTMIVIGIILSVFGIGFLCWLLFTLAVYALPFFAA